MKCKNCKINFKPKYPLQKFCFGNEECRNAAYQFAIDQKQKSWNKRKKKLKEELKTLSDYKKDLETEINKIVRLIDYGSNCMMCDKPMNKKNACHYHSVGSNESLRFNLHNIHIGCENCNTHKSGNIIEYDETLIKYYGSEYWEYVKFDIKRLYKLIKLSKDDIKLLIKKARLIVKELENCNKIRTFKERKQLRDIYNKELGIYD